MVKLLENTFRIVNIGLVNELAMMCDKMGIDVWEVIDAAATKPFGFMPFYPGPGLGGHCIPIDPLYLSWKAKMFDFEARFIDLAAQVNRLMPHHVVQRGHNRNTVFVDEEDFIFYLDTLREWSQNLQVKVYAWCLMSNHVHLLLDPGDDIKSIGLLMKRLAGKQTRYVNKQKRRTGSLWDGRYKMSIVNNDQYFLQCCRYIELNPVKAKMVNRPQDYDWSSYGENAGLSSAEIVDRHGFAKLADINFDNYRAFVAEGCSVSEADFLSQRIESNRLTGGDRFVEEIELRTGIRLEFKRPGRPKNAKVADQEIK